MKELIRDTIPGHLLRLATGRKVLQYEEERDSSLWKRYIDKEKSGRLAHHGKEEEEEEEEEEKKQEANESGDGNSGAQQRDSVAEGNNTSNTRNSSNTRVGSGEAQRNEIYGVPIDPEKGRDVSLVTWFGDDDPEVHISQGSYVIDLC
jgi:DHA1 family multidrug resistance protein-like MFS transporter